MAASQCPNCKQFKFEEDQPLMFNWGFVLLVVGIFMAFLAQSFVGGILAIIIGVILMRHSKRNQKITTYKCKNCSYEQTYK